MTTFQEYSSELHIVSTTVAMRRFSETLGECPLLLIAFKAIYGLKKRRGAKEVAVFANFDKSLQLIGGRLEVAISTTVCQGGLPVTP
ncbi:hypothetical protein KIN20_014617 [Parelaphostrongylus tenuis]|uniref:Uncharacterized protein n=1 Tax=Parelaphostrongylus tenuis TaxID=148309 RepID=A0AAD5QS13_PARTN|nr:hypothetical protein KIN20_014617 [Parelaphostrongylus tenuis]